jgi:hypothetical protein
MMMSKMITPATAYQMRRSLKSMRLRSLLPLSILAEIPLACHRSLRFPPASHFSADLVVDDARSHIGKVADQAS